MKSYLAIFAAMRKHHLVIAGAAFLMCLMSMYYGIRIFNANENHLITELNELDKIIYDNIQKVPMLSFSAALFTLPMIVIIAIFEMIVLFKVVNKKAKNLGLGMLITVGIILIFDILILMKPAIFDFSKWGFIWICLGLILIAGNVLSYVLRKGEK